MRDHVLVKSLARAGRVIPRRERGLRASVVVLRAGERMEWHTTGQREELLLVLAGRIRLELGDHPARRRRRVIRAGQCAWLGGNTPHRVLNESRASARYLYVTG